MLDIVANYHCTQFQEKIMNQNWENAGKPSARSNLLPFGPNLVLKTFFVAFNSTRCYPLLEAITVCNFKEN